MRRSWIDDLFRTIVALSVTHLRPSLSRKRGVRIQIAITPWHAGYVFYLYLVTIIKDYIGYFNKATSTHVSSFITHEISRGLDPSQSATPRLNQEQYADLLPSCLIGNWISLKFKSISSKRAGLTLPGEFLWKFETSIEPKRQGTKEYKEQSADDLQKEQKKTITTAEKELRLLNKS